MGCFSLSRVRSPPLQNQNQVSQSSDHQAQVQQLMQQAQADHQAAVQLKATFLLRDPLSSLLTLRSQANANGWLTGAPLAAEQARPSARRTLGPSHVLLSPQADQAQSQADVAQAQQLDPNGHPWSCGPYPCTRR